MKKNKAEGAGQDMGKEWTEAGLGELPPFTHLDVGDELQGTLVNVRESEQTEGKGKKAVTKRKVNLEIELTQDGTYTQGSHRKKTAKRVNLTAGSRIAFAIGGNMSTLLQDAVLKAAGEALGEDQELDAKFLLPLRGKELQIVRHPDGEIKSGVWKGNPVKRYSMRFR
jgi:hypothetical protein